LINWLLKKVDGLLQLWPAIWLYPALDRVGELFVSFLEIKTLFPRGNYH
jgi:hypothetical protein